MDKLTNSELIKIIEDKNKLIVQKTIEIAQKDSTIKKGERLLTTNNDRLVQLNAISQLRTAELRKYQEIVEQVLKEKNELIQQLATAQNENKCLRQIVKLSEKTSLALMKECEKKTAQTAKLIKMQSKNKKNNLSTINRSKDATTPSRLHLIPESPAPKSRSKQKKPVPSHSATMVVTKEDSHNSSQLPAVPFQIPLSHSHSLDLGKISDVGRIQTLIKRNLKLKPHLRSTYSVELQHFKYEEDFLRYGSLPNIRTNETNQTLNTN